jgi:rubrerythrin
VSEEAGGGTDLGRREDGFVPFLAAGEPAAGEFRCSECGYGVSVYRALPICPMCGGAAWEHEQRSPLARIRELQR